MENKKRIGFAMCGSYCTYSRVFEEAERLTEKYELIPIMSENAAETDSRFGAASENIKRLMQITGRHVVTTIAEAEPLGPREPMEAMVIAPCTGNTLAKLANGVTDTAVTMAAKAHLRSDRPLVLALASNDALSANLRNIGILLSRKHIYFVPMVQDDPEGKPHSLVADFSCLARTLESALAGRQERRLFL